MQGGLGLYYPTCWDVCEQQASATASGQLAATAVVQAAVTAVPQAAVTAGLGPPFG